MTKEIGDNTLLDTWAKDGAIQEPNLSKIAVGWLSGERPAFQWFNWIINGVQKKINYILKRGIADWHEETEYDVGDIVNRNGIIFIAEVSNVGEPPPNILFWREPGPLDNLAAITDPTSSNDITEGYSVGSKWYNQATKEAFLCFDNTEGAAVWEHATLDTSDLGSAALKNTGSGPGDVPLNSNLGALAGKTKILIEDIDTTGMQVGQTFVADGLGGADGKTIKGTIVDIDFQSIKGAQNYTGLTATPGSNSTPLITQGVQLFSWVQEAQSEDNKIIIEADIIISNPNYGYIHLFRNGVHVASKQSVYQFEGTFGLKIIADAETTDPVTWSIRGASAAATVVLNQYSGNNFGNGLISTASFMELSI